MPAIVRSILSVFAGLLTVVILSEGTDEILRGLGAPMTGEGPHANEMLAAATTYRTLAGVAGGYITATLAPANPMRHTVILGVIGLALSILGIVMNAIYHLGPDWYPVALAVTAFPSAWLGGRLRAAPASEAR